MPKLIKTVNQLLSEVNRSDDLNSLDPTDLKILLELIRDPRIQIGELSEKLGIARNTAQSRVRRMQRSGLLHDGGREIDLEAVGYDVVAFVTIEVNHRELDGVVGALRLIAQVLEVHEISGRGECGAAWWPPTRTTCRPPCAPFCGSRASSGPRPSLPCTRTSSTAPNR